MTDPSMTPPAVQQKVVRGESRKIVRAYIRRRLAPELEARGAAEAIADKTGFTSSHLSAFKRGKIEAGDDFAHAIAAYWGMTYAELEAVARAEHEAAKCQAGESPAA